MRKGPSRSRLIRSIRSSVWCMRHGWLLIEQRNRGDGRCLNHAGRSEVAVKGLAVRVYVVRAV